MRTGTTRRGGTDPGGGDQEQGAGADPTAGVPFSALEWRRDAPAGELGASSGSGAMRVQKRLEMFEEVMSGRGDLRQYPNGGAGKQRA